MRLRQKAKFYHTKEN